MQTFGHGQNITVTTARHPLSISTEAAPVQIVLMISASLVVGNLEKDFNLVVVKQNLLTNSFLEELAIKVLIQMFMFLQMERDMPRRVKWQA